MPNTTNTLTQISAAELRLAADYLTSTLDAVLAACHGLSASQLSAKPNATAWSIEQTLEHMVIVEEFTLGPLAGMLLSATPQESEAPTHEVDAFIQQAFADRTYKVDTPPFLVPPGTAKAAESLQRLRDNNEKLIAMLGADCIFRNLRIDSMPLESASQGRYRTMDGYQFILFTATHNARHTKQILELR
jgi:hypothetical protein